jgi:hypothetical protein
LYGHVKRTLRWKNHIKIVIFNGTLIFQIFLHRYRLWSFQRSKYINLMIKLPKFVILQTKVSCSCDRCPYIKRSTTSIHRAYLLYVMLNETQCLKVHEPWK